MGWKGTIAVQMLIYDTDSQWLACHITGRLANAHELVKGPSSVKHAAKMAKRPFELSCIAWIPSLNRDRDKSDLKQLDVEYQRNL